MRRIGHKGADLIVPGNTAASFDKAVELGVDMIEFDVLPEHWPMRAESRLLLAHDHEHPLDGAPTLEAGLDHLVGLGIDIQVDLKLPGYEAKVVEALRARGLVERALVSTMFMRSLVKIRSLEPALKLAWSVPRVRRDYTTSPLYRLPALVALARLRRRLPGRAAAHLQAGRIDALMAHFRLVTPALLRTVHEHGGELYVWTVDDAAEIARLEAMGVDGIVTNDPRLFGDQEIRQVAAL